MRRIFCIIFIGFIILSCEGDIYAPPTEGLYAYPDIVGPLAFQNKLVGKWTGDAEELHGLTWKIDITFIESGHYIASAYDLSDTLYDILSPFYFGFKYVETPDGETILTPPSPDVPCQSFVLDYVLKNKGHGFLSIANEYERIGKPYSFGCFERFEIENLEFTNGGNNMAFELFLIGMELDYCYLKYKLKRVNE